MWSGWPAPWNQKSSLVMARPYSAQKPIGVSSWQSMGAKNNVKIMLGGRVLGMGTNQTHIHEQYYRHKEASFGKWNVGLGEIPEGLPWLIFWLHKLYARSHMPEVWVSCVTSAKTWFWMAWGRQSVDGVLLSWCAFQTVGPYIPLCLPHATKTKSKRVATHLTSQHKTLNSEFPLWKDEVAHLLQRDVHACGSLPHAEITPWSSGMVHERHRCILAKYTCMQTMNRPLTCIYIYILGTRMHGSWLPSWADADMGLSGVLSWAKIDHNRLSQAWTHCHVASNFFFCMDRTHVYKHVV